MNNLFQNALKRVPQRVPPIWFMRQAGRYHSHYQKLRAKHSFKDLCLIPELAAEVALGPILDFDFDVSILFSDLLFPLEAMGMGLEYGDGGPELGFRLDRQSFSRLKPAPDALPFMRFQKQALQLTRQRLPQDKSLIGFVGGPWTLFVYAVEGGHSGSLTTSKSDPQLLKQFESLFLPFLEGNIELQLEGGAEVVMIFDTAAGEVSPSYFREFVAPSLKRLAQKFPGRLGYYSKGTQSSFFSSEFISLPWAGVGFDHRWDLTTCFKQGWSGFVQGNFDQALLHMETSDLKAQLQPYLQNFKKLSPEHRSGWVCGLGHGILPKTPEKNVRLFVETVRRELA